MIADATVTAAAVVGSAAEIGTAVFDLAVLPACMQVRELQGDDGAREYLVQVLGMTAGALAATAGQASAATTCRQILERIEAGPLGERAGANASPGPTLQ